MNPIRSLTVISLIFSSFLCAAPSCLAERAQDSGISAGCYKVYRDGNATSEWVRIDRDGSRTTMMFYGPQYASLPVTGQPTDSGMTFPNLKFLNYIATPVRPGQVPEGLTLSREGENLVAQVKARPPYSLESLTLKPVKDDRAEIFDLYERADAVMDASGPEAVLDRFFVESPRTSFCLDKDCLLALMKSWVEKRPKNATHTRIYRLVRVHDNRALIETIYLTSSRNQNLSERRLDCLVKTKEGWRFVSTEIVAGDRMQLVSDSGYGIPGDFLPRAPGWTLHVLMTRTSKIPFLYEVVQFSPNLDASFSVKTWPAPETLLSNEVTPVSLAEADLLRMETQYPEYEEGEIVEKDINGRKMAVADWHYSQCFGTAHSFRYYMWTQKFIYLTELDLYDGNKEKRTAEVEKVLAEAQLQ